MLIEIIGSVDEFLAKINRNYGIHYETEGKVTGAAGEIALVKLILYGLADDRIIICEIAKMVTWKDREVRTFGSNNAMENLRAWIEKQALEFESLAEKLGATRGKYEWKS
jgi:hypothetical protein